MSVTLRQLAIFEKVALLGNTTRAGAALFISQSAVSMALTELERLCGGELFARTAAEHIDDMCILRSMHADVPNHEPSLMLMNCGDGRLPRPSMGSWLTYGLGTENQNLPGFVVLSSGVGTSGGTSNWTSGFLPL